MFTKKLKCIFTIIIFYQATNLLRGETLGARFQNETGLLLSLEMLKGYKIEIPEGCKKTQFCENIPNYPEEFMVEYIKMLGDTISYNKDTVPFARIKNNRGLSLCDSEIREIVPLAVMDEAGRWALVLNSKQEPVQHFYSDVCKIEEKTYNSGCTNISFQPGYYGKCMDTYVRKKLLVIDGQTNQIKEQSLSLPYCCVCRDMRNKI